MKTPPFSGRVQRYDAVDSTNDRAHAALAAGTGAHGDAFLAREQLAGRGTRGRRWSSARGGLYLSMIARTDALPPAGLWTVAGAVAVHDACSAAGVRVELDWPNDVVAGPDRAKLAGVLAESRGPATDYVIGIGVNVAAGAVAQDVARERPTTSLAEQGCTLDPRSFSDLLLEALEGRLGEAAADAPRLFEAFFERCHLRHRRVRVELSARALEGTFVGLDPDRGVLLGSATYGLTALQLGHVTSLDALEPTAD
ncbi:MAG: biotin--[acetyl-CoA-carboxylase] ligase [Planctomycetota bacterium]